MLYFDNAATSYPKPPSVAQAVYDAIGTLGNPSRGAYELSLAANRLVYSTRIKLCNMFHGPGPLHVAFTSNVTESLNAVISTMLSSTDHVITTAWEHNSVLRPLYQKGCEISFVPMEPSGCLDYGALEKSLTAKTKAVVCTHASNVTGDITDIHYIGEFCQKHGLLFILDTAQTAGFLPINMEEDHIDVLCFTGHKSLLGPQGTGGICIGSSGKILLKPFKAGGSGSHSFNKEHPANMPDCFEAGTVNAHGIAGLAAGLDYIHQKGLLNIQKTETHLASLFYEGVAKMPQIKVYGNFQTSLRCPVVSINIGDYDSASVSQELFDSFQICTRAGAHCAPLMHEGLGTKEQGVVRFSFSAFHTEEDIIFALDAIKTLTK